jgi:hypothetical protein
MVYYLIILLVAFIILRILTENGVLSCESGTT